MPCICYGAVSGKEEYDKFIQSDKGKQTLEYIIKAASLIMSHPLDQECMPMEFRQMFVKCFLHMMVGCDEKMNPILNNSKVDLTTQEQRAPTQS